MSTCLGRGFTARRVLGSKRRRRASSRTISSGWLWPSAEVGTPVGEICHHPGFSAQTFYRWRKRFGALGVYTFRTVRAKSEEGDYDPRGRSSAWDHRGRAQAAPLERFEVLWATWGITMRLRRASTNGSSCIGTRAMGASRGAGRQGSRRLYRGPPAPPCP